MIMYFFCGLYTKQSFWCSVCNVKNALVTSNQNRERVHEKNILDIDQL